MGLIVRWVVLVRSAHENAGAFAHFCDRKVPAPVCALSSARGATRFRTRDEAESAALLLVAHAPVLMGRVEVMEYTVGKEHQPVEFRRAHDFTAHMKEPV